MHFLTANSGTVYTPAGRPRRGGQAQVWPALGPNGRKVAVKVAHDPSDTSDRLRHEHRELSRLLASHSELRDVVVEVLDVGHDDGCAFLVLPWYDHDLHTWLQGRSLLDRARASVAACRAVIGLHRSALDFRQGVVHRDIKPRNLLVAGEGDDGALHLVLADFGGARRTIGGTATIGSGFHTRGYAPPDQALPRKAPPDRSWDVHALAVTVYECLVGRVPTGTMSASYAYRPEGHELLALAEQAARTSLVNSQQQRFDSLVNQPVHALVDIGGIEPISPSDSEALVHTLQGAPGLSADRAEMLADDLMDALRDALATDPSERQSDARPIMKVCQRVVRRLQRAGEKSSLERETRSGPVALVGMSVALPSRPPPSSAIDEGEEEDGAGPDPSASVLDPQTTTRASHPRPDRPPPLPASIGAAQVRPASSQQVPAPILQQAKPTMSAARRSLSNGESSEPLPPASVPPGPPPGPPSSAERSHSTGTRQPLMPGFSRPPSPSARMPPLAWVGLAFAAVLLGVVGVGGWVQWPSERAEKTEPSEHTTPVDAAVLSEIDETDDLVEADAVSNSVPPPSKRPSLQKSGRGSSKKSPSRSTSAPTKPPEAHSERATKKPSPEASRRGPAPSTDPGPGSNDGASTTLRIETAPPGATVSIDGVARGTSPVELSVSVRAHDVLLTLKGHQTVRYPVEVGPQGKTTRVKLTPVVPKESGMTGKVKFVGTKGTIVNLGERRLGRVPFTTTLSEGEHRFGIQPPGGGARSYEVIHIEFQEGGSIIVPIQIE